MRGARVGQTAWESQHPCLLPSVNWSLPETTQARIKMGGAPRQFALPFFAGALMSRGDALKE